MINIKDVLTATPVVLERIPGNVQLSSNVGPLIQGLNAASISIDGYTLDNIATKLPEETKESSEHDELMNASAVKIATVIRESLNAIRTYIIPSCDLIQKKICSVGTPDSITDMIFGKLFLNFYHLPNSFFESPIFPTEPDARYRNGVLYSSSNLTKLGDWPEKSYEEILPLLSAAANYPELHAALQDKKAVEGAWDALGKPAYWLGTQHTNLDPRNVDISPRDLNKLIVLSLLVNKFAGEEDPQKGVTNVSLEEYRDGLLKTKAFLNTVLYYAKTRYATRLGNGLIIADSDVKYEKCAIKESHFFGSNVLNGGAVVVYNDTLADYFGNSDDYSLSGIVTGILYAQLSGKRIPTGDFLSLLPFYKEAEQEYAAALSTTVIVNIRNATAEHINSALSELANGPLWKDYLSEDGKYQNLFYRLDDLIKANGGITQALLLPSVIDSIRKGEVAVANTIVAPVLAEVLGAPIAAEILRNNIQTEATSPERQRKLAGKAIAKVVVEKLLAK